ncbi:MAG: sugar ABC transporter permease [FCB group bacterium]|nr:sugar ABC transporter permease [FCB group bacterium]
MFERCRQRSSLPAPAAAGLLRVPDAVLGWLDDRLERWSILRGSDVPTAALLLAPALLILGAFGIAPLFGALFMSLFDSDDRFVGLANYARAFGDREFWNSLFVTAYYAFCTIPVTLVLSFVIAYALFRLGRGRGFFRTVYFLPYVTSAVAAATVWRVIFHPQVGLVNTLLAKFGVSELPTWMLEPRGVLYLLTDGAIPVNVGPSLALLVIMLFEVWHSSGFAIVLFLTGLTAIPRELEEAARIDGANRRQLVFRVILPLLSPTLFFLAVVSVIRAFQAFNAFYALTGNGRGPVNTTQNLTVYIYTNLYEYHDLGYGATVATLLCVAIVALTLVQWRVLGRRVHYE